MCGQNSKKKKNCSNYDDSCWAACLVSPCDGDADSVRGVTMSTIQTTLPPQKPIHCSFVIMQSTLSPPHHQSFLFSFLFFLLVPDFLGGGGHATPTTTPLPFFFFLKWVAFIEFNYKCTCFQRLQMCSPSVCFKRSCPIYEAKRRKRKKYNCCKQISIKLGRKFKWQTNVGMLH